MTDVRTISSIDEAKDRWPASVRVSWFCLVVVFAGLIDLALDLSGLSIPAQALARIVLLASAILTLIIVQKDRRDLVPPGVRLASAFVFYAAVISFVKDSFASVSFSSSTADFIFMYGVGALLILAAVVPLSAHFGTTFFVLTAASVGFGLLQLFSQHLFLPVGYLDSIGLLYENFVNDRVRVVSFFHSAPRFAEFLTIISLIILSQVLRPSSEKLARRNGLLLLIYGLCVILLFNTYSRAGYVLFLSSTLVMLFLMRTPGGNRRGFGLSASYLLLVTSGSTVFLAAVGKLPFDRAILDTTSYRSRQATWSILSDRINAGSFADLLFGFGDTARFSRGDFGYFTIDNLSLALFLYGGVAGFLAALVMSAVSVRFAVSVRRFGARTFEPWIAFIPCLWIEGLFVDNHHTLFIALIAMLGLASSARRMQDVRINKVSCPELGS